MERKKFMKILVSLTLGVLLLIGVAYGASRFRLEISSKTTAAALYLDGKECRRGVIVVWDGVLKPGCFDRKVGRQ